MSWHVEEASVTEGTVSITHAFPFSLSFFFVSDLVHAALLAAVLFSFIRLQLTLALLSVPVLVMRLVPRCDTEESNRIVIQLQPEYLQAVKL